MEKQSLKRNFLFVFGVGIFFGIFQGYLLGSSSAEFIFIIFLGLVSSVFLFLKEETTLSIFVLIFGVGLVLGLWRFDVKSVMPEEFLIEKNGEKIELVGVISSDRQERLGRMEYELRNVSISNGSLEQEISGKILIRGEFGERFEYGDKVKWEGSLSLPSPFETDTGRIFDYKGFLLKDGVVATLSFARGEKVGENQGNFVKKILFSRVIYKITNNFDIFIHLLNFNGFIFF